jgi:hypothetical protein
MSRTRGAGGCGGRSSAGCLVLLLVGFLCGALGNHCPDAEELKVRTASATTGNFLSGTISWKQVGTGNRVAFELISTWRRKHHWPCKSSGAGAGFSGPDHWPGVGDELTIVGLSSVQSKQARQELSGPVSTKLWTGKGRPSSPP